MLHRGGAPFLSPADALLLSDWLEAEVPLRAVMAAIERCAVSRRRAGARTRFTLVSTKRHLHKPPLQRVDLEPAEPIDHPYRPVIDALEEHAHPVAQALADDLVEMGDHALEEVVAVCAQQIERGWTEQSNEDRTRRMAEAVSELGDIANLVDEATLLQLAEEVARHTFRAEWPRLDTALFEVLRRE